MFAPDPFSRPRGGLATALLIAYAVAVYLFAMSAR